MAGRAESIADEEGFEPCRDERCTEHEVGIHPAHDLDRPRNRLRCPLCDSHLVTLPRRRARCLNCQWRGHRAEAALKNGDQDA